MQSIHRLSVAPMMERTDRFYRYFLRLITRHTLLYTEMITSAAVLNGDRDQLLAFDAAEHPVALQLGGSEPGEMAACARIAEEHGFDEVNMNVGCPSKRVRAGRFGACLMAEPQRVADCVAAMASTVGIPVTVKTRIGIDEQDSYEALAAFVSLVAGHGCNTFIVHARKAWLTGLSPKQNRDVPPLRYDIVHQLKQDFPSLTIILNGGVTTLDQTRQHLSRLDGVMIGRAAYRDPYMLAQADRQIFDTKSAAPSRREIIEAYLPYAARELQRGARLAHLTRHLTGLYLGQPGARAWRRAVSALASIDGATEQDLLGAIPQCSTQAAALANDAAA
ncbi:MAG: tRNA dihydrouridine(20/20a) synthase DusA [Proteobacteria bacterium]|nr:tRNA dihydrouridine(20/20a) synthase DusA [Pseudomonadota bacterium]